jgi:hypothetical protein
VPEQSKRKRFATIVLGHTVDQIVAKAYNYGVYTFVLVSLGMKWGTVVMTLLSFLVCLAYIKLYDWAKRDWLGLELLKEIREDEGKGNWFSKILRRGDWVALVILSLWKDAFYTTVYMRKGAHEYSGMGKREWKIFITSLLIGCFGWSLWLSFWLNLPKIISFVSHTLTQILKG